jgi:predicted nucleic acid-binding protein
MVYIDTSVVVALLAREPKSVDVMAWFRTLDAPPTSADWLVAEFSSAISIKVRSGQIGEAQGRRLRKEFAELVSAGLRLVAVSRQAIHRAAELIAQHQSGLRSGDSLHLAMALELGAEQIATLDATLARNAKRNGLALTAL